MSFASLYEYHFSLTTYSSIFHHFLPLPPSPADHLYSQCIDELIAFILNCRLYTNLHIFFAVFYNCTVGYFQWLSKMRHCVYAGHTLHLIVYYAQLSLVSVISSSGVMMGVQKKGWSAYQWLWMKTLHKTVRAQHSTNCWTRAASLFGVFIKKQTAFSVSLY